AICNSNGLDLLVVDVGVDTPDIFEKIRKRKATGSKGSRSILHVDGAMTCEQLTTALEAGQEMAQDAIRRLRQATGTESGFAIGLGELGIANTTISAALLLAVRKYQGKVASADDIAGLGTGVTEERFAKKVSVIARAVELHENACLTTVNLAAGERWLEVLRRLGGLEIAAMAAAAREIALASVPLIIDGFISSVAFLMALLVFPEHIPALQRVAFFSHKSMERSALMVITEIEEILEVPVGTLQPALSLDLRLGEGTGAALAFPLLQAAAHIATDMSTFEQAAVSGS
ncbi:hypothetical protein HDU96_005637, partial [Phlyctochytrium bullatum]